MPKQIRTLRRSQSGFSLVELMVALLFTGLLMSGMARVYQASLSSFATSAERIAAGRRGRMAIDMISDDLNQAGMYLTNLTQYPDTVQISNPGFWINPNISLTLSDGTVAKADQLNFYYDEALPFEAVVVSGSGQAGIVPGATDFEASGTAVDNSSLQFTIKTPSTDFAAMVKPGNAIIIKDAWPYQFADTVTTSGDQVTIVPKQAERSATTGASTGAAWIPPRHRPDSPVTIVNPAQMVTYSLEARYLDPANPGTSIPCLVRTQGTYTAAGMGAVSSTQIIAEDVSKVEVYLSVDAGRTWIRENAATGFVSGWDNGYRPRVETALASGYGRTRYTNLSNPSWFRDIPLVVRVDVTTRTAVKRSEYVNGVPPAGGLAYREQTHSLIIRPRHFGLSYN